MKAIVMMGLPGAGKNYYVKKNLADILHVSRDDIRNMLFQNGYVSKLECIVKQIMIDTCRLAAKNKLSIVINETLVEKHKRHLLICELKDMGYEEIDLVFIDTHKDVCIKRRSQSDPEVWAEVINDMNNRLERPSKDEGFSTIITVEGL